MEPRIWFGTKTRGGLHAETRAKQLPFNFSIFPLMFFVLAIIMYVELTTYANISADDPIVVISLIEISMMTAGFTMFIGVSFLSGARPNVKDNNIIHALYIGMLALVGLVIVQVVVIQAGGIFYSGSAFQNKTIYRLHLVSAAVSEEFFWFGLATLPFWFMISSGFKNQLTILGFITTSIPSAFGFAIFHYIVYGGNMPVLLALFLSRFVLNFANWKGRDMTSGLFAHVMLNFVVGVFGS